MKILFIGDIVARIGCDATKRVLPQIKADKQIDFTIANGEHLSDRVGLNLDTVREMQAAGIDFFTTGNHVWRKKQFVEHLAKDDIPVLRPANYPAGAPGDGYRVIDTPKGKILVINLLGKEGINANLTSPFEKADQILTEVTDYKYSFVDFHAEMTSEKVALGRYLDGRVSAVVGTHIHVPTADARVLAKGTAVVTDVGYVGPRESVLGVKEEIIFDVFKTGLPQVFEVAEGDCVFNSVVIELNDEGKAVSIERVDKVITSTI
jgi:metallophosphoesterase (TIGR00282 family)